MIVKISLGDGKTMSTVKEQKVATLDEIVNEIKWMNENGINGGFDFISENEADEMFLEMLKQN